jgi:DNA-directed RNA polymerase subunit RPC12/RpoP
MKSRFLTYLMILAFVVALAIVLIPILDHEIHLGADGMPIGAVRIIDCPYCDGKAKYDNPGDGTEGEYFCERCGMRFFYHEVGERKKIGK